LKNLDIKIPVLKPFVFQSALNSHGWVDLLPNTHDPVTPSFSRVEEMQSGDVVHLNVSSDGESQNQQIIISVGASRQLASHEKEYLKSSVSHMLRLDEDFSEFYDLCKTRGGTWKGAARGIGRLLRSPGVFEDLVKVICTTNVQWGGTKRMVQELVNMFGRPYGDAPEQKTFPTFFAIASLPFDEFQQKVRLGYRTDYVHRLARQFADGELNALFFQNRNTPTEEIRNRLLAIKGVGNYAAASMLMLLGRYDHIPVDTVFRQFMTEKYFKGLPFSLPDALAIYDDWDQWKYLAYWFDMISFENTIK